ncbi:MAG: hypothetical protein HXX15_14210 [Rhodopseudomonas sp.]|uniref:hypothetical protein n=1 Tax=Rhodopseudomonas sp. TaxID=1078 RepID=UPI00182F8496|nr:hypothetical protein [Rhodopseudomonas sp.]NVN87229.1 hypothetical protein [Rhodopseudomonas sp.]
MTSVAADLGAELLLYLRQKIPNFDYRRDLVLIDLGYFDGIQQSFRSGGILSDRVRRSPPANPDCTAYGCSDHRAAYRQTGKGGRDRRTVPAPEGQL